MASRSLVEGHAADLGEHLNLEQGDAETIRIAFGREVARCNHVCTKGRAKGLERGKYALGIGARRVTYENPLRVLADPNDEEHASMEAVDRWPR